MKNSTELEMVEQLLAHDRADGRLPCIASDERDSVIAGLERVLVDAEAQRQHIHRLCDLLRDRVGARHRKRLNGAQTKQVLEQGLEILSNQELTALAVSAVGIAGLSVRIQDDLSQKWIAVIEREFAAWGTLPKPTIQQLKRRFQTFSPEPRLAASTAQQTILLSDAEERIRITRAADASETLSLRVLGYQELLASAGAATVRLYVDGRELVPIREFNERGHAVFALEGLADVLDGATQLTMQLE